jgi:hypothetical protein
MNKIDNTNRNFKGQLETEEVLCFCRKHWIVLFKDFLGMILFIVVMGLIAFNFQRIYKFFSQDSFFIKFFALSLIILFTIYIHRFFLRMIHYFLDIVIITNYRIVILDKSLYLRDSKDAIDLPKIQDIEKNQSGILRKIFNFGQLIITLSSTSTTKVLRFIPNPDYHFRKINKCKREYIKERLSKREQKTLHKKDCVDDNFQEFSKIETATDALPSK